jgi:hypothetical protein
MGFNSAFKGLILIVLIANWKTKVLYRTIASNILYHIILYCRLRLKCDGVHAENRFRLSARRRSPFKSAGASVQSTTGRQGVRISGRNAGYTMFRGSVKSTGYPFHSPVSPSLPHPCVTVCHHISTGVCQKCSATKLSTIFSYIK